MKSYISESGLLVGQKGNYLDQEFEISGVIVYSGKSDGETFYFEEFYCKAETFDFWITYDISDHVFLVYDKTVFGRDFVDFSDAKVGKLLNLDNGDKFRVHEIGEAKMVKTIGKLDFDPSDHEEMKYIDGSYANKHFSIEQDDFETLVFKGEIFSRTKIEKIFGVKINTPQARTYYKDFNKIRFKKLRIIFLSALLFFNIIFGIFSGSGLFSKTVFDNYVLFECISNSDSDSNCKSGVAKKNFEFKKDTNYKISVSPVGIDYNLKSLKMTLSKIENENSSSKNKKSELKSSDIDYYSFNKTMNFHDPGKYEISMTYQNFTKKTEKLRLKIEKDVISSKYFFIMSSIVFLMFFLSNLFPYKIFFGSMIFLQILFLLMTFSSFGMDNEEAGAEMNSSRYSDSYNNIYINRSTAGSFSHRSFSSGGSSSGGGK